MNETFSSKNSPGSGATHSPESLHQAVIAWNEVALPEAPDGIYPKDFGQTRRQLTLGDRAYPSISQADTVEGLGGKIFAHHNAFGAKFIGDDSIRKVHVCHRDWEYRGMGIIPAEIPIGKSVPGLYCYMRRYPGRPLDSLHYPILVYGDQHEPGLLKHLIPQQAQRSCGYTCVAMIFLDACSRFGVTDIPERRAAKLLNSVIDGNLSQFDVQVGLLREATKDTGLRPEIWPHRIRQPQILDMLLQTYGPAVAGIDGEIGGHCIVIDRITDGSSDSPIITMRDPFHGWSIDVPFSSLKSRKIELNNLLFCVKQNS